MFSYRWVVKMQFDNDDVVFEVVRTITESGAKTQASKALLSQMIAGYYKTKIWYDPIDAASN